MIRERKDKLMKRRKIAIVVSALLVAILIPVFIIVYDFATSVPFEDVDGTKYLIKYKNGVFAMYDKDGDKLKTESEYGFYITDIGTLVKVDGETGEFQVIAVLDTEYNERFELGSGRLLVFPHIEAEQIRSIEVVNSEGSFTFHRYNTQTEKEDDSADFVVKGAPYAMYNKEAFISFRVNAGYTLATCKIEDPIKDENGEYTEYGLAPEIRIDEEGNEYQYVPAYYILTDTSGNRYKLIIGDMLVTGGGYYVQYVDISDSGETKRDKVYVLDTGMKCMLEPVEVLMEPMLTYPLSLNTYYNVENFLISKKDSTAQGGRVGVVGFSYIDMADRQGSINSSIPYKFTLAGQSGYIPNTNNITHALENICQPSFVGVKKLMPTEEDLIEYGIMGENREFDSEYTISFDSNITDDNDKVVGKVSQMVMISEKDPDTGNYYAYVSLYQKNDKGEDEFWYSYDMIVEVEGHSLEFLTWPSYEWIEDALLPVNIAFLDTLKIETPDGYWAEFKLDNSKTPQTSTNVMSTNLEVVGKDSNGNLVNTFSYLEVTDTSGVVWNITQTDVTAKNAITGQTLEITTAYYAYNKLDKQARALSGYIVCNDGRKVSVTADTVEVTETNGTKTTYIRYATDLFRRYFETIAATTIEDQYLMSPEEENALVSDTSKLLLTITIIDTDGGERVCRFYSLADKGATRKAYLTSNGNGGFYVLSTRIPKIVSDANKFFAFEPIDSASKK